MGELNATVRAVRDEALDVHSLELAAAHDRRRPSFTAGSPIDLQVAPGVVRQYSLCNDPREPGRCVIAVKRKPSSRGGSSGMHERGRLGGRLVAVAPRNSFAQLENARHHLLLARRRRHWIPCVIA